MKLQAIGIREGDKPFRTVNHALFREQLDKLPQGRYRITVEKMRKNKTCPQLGYYFAGVLPLFLQHLIDAGWEFTSIEEVDNFAKSMFAKKDVINRNTGEIVTMPALKRDMSTVELNTLIESIRNWDAEYLGGYIPDPETQLSMYK